MLKLLTCHCNLHTFRKAYLKLKRSADMTFKDHHSTSVCSPYYDIKKVLTCFRFVATKPNHVLNHMGAGNLALDLA